MLRMAVGSFTAVLAIASALLLGAAAPASAAKAKADALRRPALESHQGRYFRWAAPSRWKTSETSNGVTLDAPDGSMSVQFALLLRSRGTMSAENFLLMALGSLPGYGNVHVKSTKRLPDQPSGVPGTSWKVIEAELSYTVDGKPVAGIWTCGINSYYGMYDATVLGYHAGRAQWPLARTYLPEVARSIAIYNTRSVAGNDTLIPARNNPLDNSQLIESWRQKGVSEDRIGKARREGTSGYERVIDPQSGRVYEMPLESYDGTVGGYRNPVRPSEILQKTEPGE